MINNCKKRILAPEGFFYLNKDFVFFNYKNNYKIIGKNEEIWKKDP